MKSFLPSKEVYTLGKEYAYFCNRLSDGLIYIDKLIILNELNMSK